MCWEGHTTLSLPEKKNMNYGLPIISVLISLQQNKGDRFNLNIHL